MGGVCARGNVRAGNMQGGGKGVYIGNTYMVSMYY